MQQGVRMRLLPEDEYMHAVEEAKNYNESMYFNVFHASGRPFGGWFRIGNRPNEGYAEVSNCLYLPDGRVGFMYSRPAISHNNAFDAGGMQFNVVEPFKRLKVSCKGKVCLMKNPHDMADPKRAFKENPHVDCELEIDYEGISPMHGGEPVNEDGSPLTTKAEESFYRGHYEQHIAGKGFLKVDGTTYEIDGYGLRDHSWGPRYWQNVYWYRWLPLNFGRDFGMRVTIKSESREIVNIGGMVQLGNAYVDIIDAKVKTVWDENDYQTDFSVWVKTKEREYEIDARVLSLIPLRNRRQAPSGEWLNTRITEGMTEYRCEGRVGYGMSEYLDQIMDGKAVGKEFS